MRRLLRAGTEAGSASLELVIIAPALLALIGLIAFAGRFSTANTAVGRIASSAARDASIERTPAAARAAAQDSARSLLAGQGLHCQGTPDVHVDTTAFTTATAAGTVTVRLTCVVSIADMGFPGVPCTRTVRASAVSPVDPYRSRTDGFTNSDGQTAGNSG